MKDWHKSSYSGNQGACVEVKEGSTTDLRDTQHRDLGHLSFHSEEWTALVTAVRSQ